MLFGVRLWAKQWASRAIVIKFDNEAVVTVAHKGVTRDSALAAMVQNMWFVTASYNVKLKLIHIPGIQNVSADLLSRRGSTTNKHEKLQVRVSNSIWLDVCSDHKYVDVCI